MLFNTPEFFIFFGAVLVGYRLLRHRRQNVLLLVASYLFYGWWDWRFLGLLILTTVMDYWVGRIIQHAHDNQRPALARRGILVSIVLNLAVLGFFKYFNFFVESAAQVLRAAGYEGSLWTLHIILPVGISFYTFQSMSYTIDVYRRQLPATRSLLDFALYVSFFPQLVAGPIERATTLLPQVQRPRVVTPTDWEEGALLFGIGFFRKVAIADPAGLTADQYFANPASYTSVQLAVGLALYSIQIYNDFAGYSDMARGSARLLGFSLMRNFRHPYFATSFSDFWSRWHVSLSTWLKDYLYIPLGGNRRSRMRTQANLMITMLLGGLWHGAKWTFVIWGALHGAYLSVQHAFERAVPRPVLWPDVPPLARRIAASVLVFTTVTLTWLFFRAPDFATAATYGAGLLALTVGGEGALLPLIILGAFTLAIDLPQAIFDDEYVFLRLPVAPRAIAATSALVLVLVSGSTHAPFIYFQF